MGKLLAVLVLSVSAFSWTDDEGRDSGFISRPYTGSDDDVTLTIIDTFQLSPDAQMLGMDHQEAGNQLGVMDNDNDLIRGVETGTGDPVWSEEVPLSSTFGLCHDGPAPYDWWVSSWSSSMLHRWEPQEDEWTTPYANPVGVYGRGMDYDEASGCLWEAYSIPPSTLGAVRLDLSSGDFTLIPIPPGGPADQLAGIAVFPAAGYQHGVVVTTYDYPNWFFYGFDGSLLHYLGSDAPSVSGFDGSRGITYNPGTDTFFWTYKTTGEQRWIAEVEYDITSLEQDTWGGIKSEFQ